ncbi:MAG: acyltransferase [Nanoarchaeota archaeon]|nr:acyltransferase [Nanoarchaeota archaeon]
MEHHLDIQDRVSIAPNVIIIVTSDPNNSKLREFKNKYSFIEIKGKVTIKHDAWIGAGAIILPNVTIGEFAVVGAGSIITKDVPMFTVVAGVPAKVIKNIETE